MRIHEIGAIHGLAGAIALLLISGPATAGGNLAPEHPELRYEAGPFVVPTTAACTDPVAACDDFALTVQLPHHFAAAHPLAVLRFDLTWANVAEDYDLYLYEGGSEIGRAWMQNPRREYVQIAALSGTRQITVRVVPVTVAGGSVSVNIALVPGAAGGQRVSVHGPQYSIHQAPAELGNAAHEPTVDVNRNTNRALFLSGQQTLRVTFDDRKSPPAATWEDVSAPLTSLILGDPILTGSPHPLEGGRPNPRIFAAQLVHFEGQSLFQFTDDDGANWQVGEGGGLPAGVERSSIGVGPYPAGHDGPHAYPHAVYYCAAGGINGFCSRSDDGGRTFGAGIPIYPPEALCGPHGFPQVAADGTVYVPYMNCFAGQGVAVSEDAGRTWSMRPVPHSAGARGIGLPAIGIGAAGTLYFGYANNGNDWPRIVVSRDQGRTWGDEAAIGEPLGIVNAVFPAVVAGDDERAAFAFHGSTTHGDPAAPGFGGDWHLYVAMTADRGRSWSVSRATSDPVARATRMAGASFDTLVGGGTSLGDYMDIAVDATGRVLVGFSDGCIDACAMGAPNSHTRKAVVARQLDGKGLFARFDDRGAAGTPAKESGTDVSLLAGSLGSLFLLPLSLAFVARARWSAIALALASGVAAADPPYGEGFDAPEMPAEAARIVPGQYRATFEQPTDVDSYQFVVSHGDSIRIDCTRRIETAQNNGQPAGTIWAPCAMALLDPEGVPRGTQETSSPTAATLKADDADAGAWSLVVAGSREVFLHVNRYCYLPPCPMTDALIRSAASPPEVPYVFALMVFDGSDPSASPVPPVEGDSGGSENSGANNGGGGGGMGAAVVALLGLVAWFRRMARALAVPAPALGLLAVRCVISGAERHDFRDGSEYADRYRRRFAEVRSAWLLSAG